MDRGRGRSRLIPAIGRDRGAWRRHKTPPRLDRCAVGQLAVDQGVVSVDHQCGLALSSVRRSRRQLARGANRASGLGLPPRPPHGRCGPDKNGAGGRNRTFRRPPGRLGFRSSLCPSLGLEFSATRPPQERHSAPNTCHHGVCVAHEHLLHEAEKTQVRDCQKAESQPKRDINHRADPSLYPQGRSRTTSLKRRSIGPSPGRFGMARL